MLRGSQPPLLLHMNSFHNIPFFKLRSLCAYFQQGMAIDLFSIEPLQLDAEERMAYLDALKLPDSPLKCAKAMSHSG